MVQWRQKEKTKREVNMDITIDEMFRRLLIQMQDDIALSDEEKQKALKELEKNLKQEEIANEKE
jgi:lipase chaperone LimK